MQITGQASVQTVSAGGTAIARIGGGAELSVSELRGRYYQATRDGNMFGITGGLTTTTAAGATTFTGLIVVNPAGSGYNMAVNKCWVSQGAALTAETEIGVMYGANVAATTPLTTIFNRMAGGRASVCVASAGLTLTAAFTAFIPWCGSGSGAITVPGVIPVNGIDFEGSLIIPPGYSLASYTSRVTTSALVFTFQWEEVPIGS
jgi:hypothetical protein